MEKKFKHPLGSLAVRGLAANFSIACSPNAKLRSGIWEKPSKGYMKLNIDAGFDQDILERSVGAIIHDQSGQLIAPNEKIGIVVLILSQQRLWPSGLG